MIIERAPSILGFVDMHSVSVSLISNVGLSMILNTIAGATGGTNHVDSIDAHGSHFPEALLLSIC